MLLQQCVVVMLVVSPMAELVHLKYSSSMLSRDTARSAFKSNSKSNTAVQAIQMILRNHKLPQAFCQTPLLRMRNYK